MNASSNDFQCASHRVAGAVLLLFALCGAAVAEENAQDNHARAERPRHELPSLEAMLSAAMRNNPEIRGAESQVQVAQAETGRVRLQVALALRKFRDEWNAELAALAEAEAEMREAERMVSLPEGAVAGRVVLQSKRLVETSRQRVELTKNRLREMQQVLPLLLGTTVAEDTATGRPASEESGDASAGASDKLLRERLDVLAQIAESQREAYRGGEAGIDEVLRAQSDVLTARLELAQSDAHRIEVLEELLGIARQLEDAAAQQAHARQGRVVDALRGKAFRLRVEADLLRERGGQ